MIDSFSKFLSFEKRYSSHTIVSYLNDLNQFKSFYSITYGPIQWETVKHIHIRSWLAALASKGISNRSISRKLSSLQTFYKFLLRRGILEKNPLKKIIAPRIGKKLPYYLQESTVHELFTNDLFNKDFSGLRDRIVLELLYSTGMRRSELMNLEIHHIDLEKNLLKVLGKGGKERLIPFGHDLQSMLKNYLSKRHCIANSNNLIISDKGKKVYPKWIYNTVKKYLSLVTTAEKRGPHILRHSFATHLTNQGAELNAVKELLGHANLAATQIYTHNSIDKLKRIYEKAHPKG